MEVSFSREIEALRKGEGETFHGEGILAITKGLLQSGVAYVGGYQGAPVSHLLDVMVQAKPYMDELGVHVEACSNEASAAAMLGASIHYPLRGAVTWKSIVGTNVASDALSNLSSPGVVGGALIVVGEDYGEGASVIQERTHAFALKSTMCLLDPRPDLPVMVDMVEHAFRLSEASNMPAILELRIRACHVRGSFKTRDNQPPAVSTRQLMANPAKFDYMRLAHPPVTFPHEKLKHEKRIPAARRYILENQLNELMDGEHADLGIIVQGGLYNALLRSLQELGLANAFGESDIPLLVLNVTYPLVPEQVADFCVGKRAVIVVEEGQPEYIEQEIATLLRRRDIQTRLHGKDLLPQGGEYSVEVLATAMLGFAQQYLGGGASTGSARTDINSVRPVPSPSVHPEPVEGRRPPSSLTQARQWLDAIGQRRSTVAATLDKPLPARPPSFCVGCPERPVFAALKLAQQDIGPVHVAADIGCHALGTFEPFHTGHSILGYGMSLASRAGVSPMMQRRTLAIMGDGGFWHNGLLTGVQSALFNGDDAVLLIFKNGYSSATGTQEIISTPQDQARAAAADKGQSLVHTNQTIESTLKGLGVQWLRTVHTYEVSTMRETLKEAFTSPFDGLKVIVAEGECQLERQRRIKPWISSLLKKGKRVVRVKYGVDEDVCNGDHACIRLSGCPTLTLKDNPDPLKVDPVATVIDGCVGCGLCGANAHAATLCPSFYRAEVIQNPKWHERLWAGVRSGIVRALQPA
ncbi:indolepyruvate ferredoxin oxidoreductase subunit alpha [Ramlibacter rhizophilus]|uniref:Indolepyruvate ferredoxin oxidoreductase subunit alpha n=1 Tax=Ramlibacter rhizophilus TaxID=1781167 RepID=A0A4Z0BPJ2_9BURK|nr:indolepyruvate ferredoxin oxidoreductase subunit alpha [Ramlibacter rhizophilus]TFZ01236.1 indolepyruvate ferredoxin oxidoreductase subunit alpha [Ramlibacter rhizophilus]